MNSPTRDHKIIRLKLTVSQTEALKLTRVKRWEERSAKTNLVLGPSQP